MKHEFLPAIGPYVTDSSKQWRHPIHWLNKEPRDIHYPYCLASYALWRDEKRGLPFDRKGIVVFGDSGGYTQVTQPGYSASPTDVIKWQIKNCTRGVIFDIPPYRPGSAIQFTGSAAEWIDESIQLTCNNVKRALPEYLSHRGYRPVESSPFAWWGVVQGEAWDQMDMWHQMVSEIYPFSDPDEGWALAPKPSTDILSVTRYLRFAHEKNLRNIHLLQVTADRVVALLLALSKLAGNIDLVTYDSASALRCAINRSAIIPDGGFGQRYIKQTERNGETTVYEMMETCPCQACGWYREDKPLTNSEVPHYILLHNHLIMVQQFEATWKEVQIDADRVLRWATENEYGNVMREWERCPTALAKPQRIGVSIFDRLK